MDQSTGRPSPKYGSFVNTDKQSSNKESFDGFAMLRAAVQKDGYGNPQGMEKKKQALMNDFRTASFHSEQQQNGADADKGSQILGKSGEGQVVAVGSKSRMSG